MAPLRPEVGGIGSSNSCEPAQEEAGTDADDGWKSLSGCSLLAFRYFCSFFLVNFKQISDERGSFLPSVMFLGLLRRAMEEGKSGKVINVNIF